MSTHYASATDADCFKRSRCICMVFGVTLTPGANKSPFFCAYVSLLYSTFMCRSNTIVCWDYITKNWNRWDRDREQSKMKMNFHFSKNSRHEFEEVLNEHFNSCKKILQHIEPIFRFLIDRREEEMFIYLTPRESVYKITAIHISYLAKWIS